MTKKQICTTSPAIASLGLTNNMGVTIHRIEYDTDDHVYASVTCGDVTTYHRCKIYYSYDPEAFFYIGKMKLNMSDFMRW